MYSAVGASKHSKDKGFAASDGGLDCPPAPAGQWEASLTGMQGSSLGLWSAGSCCWDGPSGFRPWSSYLCPLGLLVLCPFAGSVGYLSITQKMLCECGKGWPLGLVSRETFVLRGRVRVVPRCWEFLDLRRTVCLCTLLSPQHSNFSLATAHV